MLAIFLVSDLMPKVSINYKSPPDIIRWALL